MTSRRFFPRLIPFFGLILCLLGSQLATSLLHAGQKNSAGHFPKMRPKVFAVTVEQRFLQPPVSLFADEGFANWTTPGGKPVGTGWEIVAGTLHRKSGAGDIITKKEYGNFQLDFTWTIARKGNSGVKYKVRKFDVGGWLGCEFQVLDDFNNPEGRRSKHESGSLYDIIAPAAQVLKPHDELNKGRVLVEGKRIRHYLNGAKTVDLTVGSPEWEQCHANSKFKDTKDFGAVETGRILVQDHGDEVWFHEMTIREIVTKQVKKYYRKGPFGKIRPVRRCR